MITFSKQRAALFVGRSCQQWIVRDPEGNFWLLPSVENPWGQRQAFHPTAEGFPAAGADRHSFTNEGARSEPVT